MARYDYGLGREDGTATSARRVVKNEHETPRWITAVNCNPWPPVSGQLMWIWHKHRGGCAIYWKSKKWHDHCQNSSVAHILLFSLSQTSSCNMLQQASLALRNIESQSKTKVCSIQQPYNIQYCSCVKKVQSNHVQWVRVPVDLTLWRARESWILQAET